jgi:hypothetical protein
MQVRDNTKFYPGRPFERGKGRMENELYIVEVLTVDTERRVLTALSLKDDVIFTDIQTFPSNISGYETIDVNMPEPGAIGVAANYAFTGGGYRQIMIIAWLHSQTYLGIDTIAQRQISGDQIKGYSDRYRPSYRKAWSGQKTAVYTGGYSEKIDIAWDRQAADLTRDKQDPNKRQWTQIAGRRVGYSDAGVQYAGSINRPTATGITPTLLPDGTNQYVVYLQPGVAQSTRYVNGQQDVIPFSENTELVQEYSLDYPVPYEVLQTSLLDTILGTTADPWARTTVTSPSGQVAYDSETYMITQTWDDPYDDRVKAVGPTLAEGPTPQRRGYIVEKTAGTLVGYSLFDQLTYGKVLKPQLFVGTPATPTLGKFGSSVESGYMPVVDSTDHAQARLAASCMSIRFAYDQNTTRLNVTKEGLVQMEIGATLPKENIPLQPTGGYEYPYGAGRSLEAHVVGSAQIVIGKNRDEEEAVDLTALGQIVLRVGSDDTSLPNARRTVQTQLRSKSDAVQNRTLQYWTESGVLLTPGDAGSLTNKTGAESISLLAAFDGGTVIRLGGKNPLAKRRHLYNGYQDGPGKTAYGVGDPSRIDSKSYRTDYGAGDSIYQFHDLTQAGAPISNFPPYVWSGSPVTSTSIPSSPMDSHGQSLDLHATRDALIRLGANPDSGQSLLLDTAGGVVIGLGKDKQGRSITGMLDGAIELTIKPNNGQQAISLCIMGDVDVTHIGNLQYLCTGDMIIEATTRRINVKLDNIETQQKKISASLARDTTEAPDIVNNQGLYTSDENS